MAQTNQINLQGRHAVVTGAAQGFGLAITTRMVASGANVSMWDIDEAELAKAAATFGDKVSTHICDVTNVDAITAAPSLFWSTMRASLARTTSPGTTRSMPGAG
jgi:NAD(P)-dependent dehydrogenase (short-subunit alcohol dehydrogenase family)